MSAVQSIPVHRSTFADAIPPTGLIALAQESQQIAVAPGEALIRQGEPADSLYMILRGRVRVERTEPDRGAPTTLAELGPGEIVGEIGAVRGTPRTAAVIAIEPTEALEVDLSALAMLVLGFPDVVDELRRTM